MATIRLLGRPAVEPADGGRRAPRGRKAWALLAYLVLAQQPPARGQVARLLFGDADDPLGALRWTLAELRRALDLTITGDPLVLALSPDTDIDVSAVRDSGVDPGRLLGMSGELLAGVALAGNPEFESWLVVARHHVAALLESRLRNAAAGLLAAGRAAEAVDYAARAVDINALDEGNHELLVRALAMTGDREAATRQAAACADLLRRELGVEPSPALRDALSVEPRSGMVRPVAGRGAARSQLEAGRAAIDAGAVDAGLQCLRRAVTEAARSGDDALHAQCLLALGSALVHAVRGRDEEGGVVLREAIEGATRTGDRATAVTAHRELGFIDVQAGRRATAEEWLARAEALAHSDREYSAIQGVRGMNASDMGDYPSAFVHFGESVERAARCGDERQRAWSLSLLGRAHLLREERSQAEAALRQSLDLVHRQRWLAFQPWPQALLAELRRVDGDHDGASQTLEEAWTLACQVGDPCWESLCARGFGLIFVDRGDHRQAGQWLREATVRANRTPDRYLWVLGHALDAAAAQAIESNEHQRATGLVAELSGLAARTQMRELTVRAQLHRHRLGDATALAGARLLAADIDNPALAALLA